MKRKHVVTIAIVVVLSYLILMFFMNITPTGGSFAIQVTGRLVDGRERHPMPQALVMTFQSRLDADDEYEVPAGRQGVEEWDAHVRERTARGEVPLLLDAPHPSGGGHTLEDGTFSFIMTVWWTWNELPIDLLSHHPPARHGIEALRIEIEGRAPVILDVPTGTWTEHDNEDGLWATWDLGVVEVPGAR